MSLAPSTESTVANQHSNSAPRKPNWASQEGRYDSSTEDFRQDEADIRGSRDRLDRMGAYGVDKFVADEESTWPGDASNHKSKTNYHPLKTGKRPVVSNIDTQVGRFDQQARDETPKANNHADGGKKFSSFKKVEKKREGVSQTLATVVQQLGSKDSHHYKHSNDEDRKEVDTIGDSSTEVDKRWEQMSAKLLDDSSAEVDSRWEQLSQRLLKGFDSSGPAFASVSDDGSDKCRDSLLNVNSFVVGSMLNQSESETFEDDLIQDCIETGLPSPQKTVAVESEQSFEEQRVNGSVGRSINSHKSYPSSLPGMNLRHATYKNHTSGDPNPSISENAKIETVASALTIEEDKEPGESTSFSSLSDIGTKTEHGSRNILKQLSSSSHEGDHSMSGPELMKVLSSASESASGIQETSLLGASPRRMYSPKSSPEAFDESIPTPRIEVALAPSDSSSDEEHEQQSESGNLHDNMPPQELQGTTKESSSNHRMLQWRKKSLEMVSEALGHAKYRKEKNAIVPSRMVPIPDPVFSSTSPRSDAACRNASLFDGTSVGDSSLSEASKAKSFQERLAVFQNTAEERTETAPTRRSRQPGEKPYEIVDMQHMEKSRAPQPNPDAESSNSRHLDRRISIRKALEEKTSVASKREAYEQAATPSASDVRARAKKFIATAKARNSASKYQTKTSEEKKSEIEPSDNRMEPKIEIDSASKAHSYASKKSLNAKKTESKVKIGASQRSFSTSKSFSTAKEPESKQKNSFHQKVLSRRKEPLKMPHQISVDQEQKERGADDPQILNVASSLTGGSSVRSLEKGSAKAAPVLRKSGKSHEVNGERLHELTVGYSGDRSFDTRLSNTSTGVPSWRMDATESLADFIIDVHSAESDHTSSFFVHKHILAVGPRRSETLEKLFRSMGQPKTKITIANDAMSLVPMVLDYMYCPDFEIEMETETVLGYRYLARLLKIIPLLAQTSKFILNDLAISNMSIYIAQTEYFQDGVLRSLIAAKCGERLDKIEISDLLWAEMDPSLFSQVVACPRIDREKMSSHLSLLIVEYQTLHKYEMNADIFETVTSESVIPLIDHKAAIPLLEICEEYGAAVVFQPLQKRCAKVMAYNWKTTPELDRKRLFALLRSLPSNFTVDFLEIVESGKAFSLLDNSSNKRSLNSEDYQGMETFTLARLCDDHPLYSSESKSLSWRMDPDYAFSDWTIKVNHRNGNKMDVYHAHRHMLAIGQYRSNFFAEAFLSGDHKRTKKGTTIIELAKEPAALVPEILDFIYDPQHDLDITTTSALAIRFLARVFGVWMLNKVVMEFVQKDINLSNMLLYIDQATTYDDDKVITLAVHKCAMAIKGIDSDSELLKGLQPDFFGRVIASPHIDKTVSCHINILIAKFFTLNGMQEAQLAELMKVIPMKEIDSESALQLLEVMSAIASNGPGAFGDIRRRCGTVLVENWKDIREENRVLAFRIFRTLESSLVTDLFDAIEKDYYQEHIESMTVQSKLVKRYRGQLADAKLQRETEVSKLREEMDATIASLMERQEELELEIAQQKDASSRRALRSNGGFAHSRIPSPKRGIGASSPHKSLIPRLSTGAKEVRAAAKQATAACTKQPDVSSEAKATTPVARNTQSTPAAMTSPPESFSSTKTPRPQPQTPSSLFGRMFHCGPTSTELHESTTTMGSPPPVQMSADHFEARLAEIQTAAAPATMVPTQMGDGTSMYHL